MRLTRIHQQFDDPRIRDIPLAVRRELEKLSPRIKRDASIALAVGSRGIRDIREIVKASVEWLRSKGAQPFIVPAMGSHGGATAEGQREILASYGIEESTVGAPVRSCMDTIPIDSQGLEARLFMDALAWKSDGIILINRVKPHTDFHGDYESGLAKMAVIGLGKHAQALEIHRFGVKGLKGVMPACARRILSTGKVIGGLAVVENAYDFTAEISVLASEEIMDREPALLEKARGLMPSLPMDELDMLIVDFIGKDVSGTGMDPIIIGRMAIRGEPEPERPRIKTIMARDVTEGSHGNALGVGFADVILRRLYDKIDFAAMYENVFTSTFFERAKIPIVAQNDAEAVSYCMRACGPVPEEKLKIARIRDTLHIGDLCVSDAVLGEIKGRGATEGSVRVNSPGLTFPLLDEDGSCPDVGVWDT
jgi:hypothetical protein